MCVFFVTGFLQQIHFPRPCPLSNCHNLSTLVAWSKYFSPPGIDTLPALPHKYWIFWQFPQWKSPELEATDSLLWPPSSFLYQALLGSKFEPSSWKAGHWEQLSQGQSPVLPAPTSLKASAITMHNWQHGRKFSVLYCFGGSCTQRHLLEKRVACICVSMWTGRRKSTDTICGWEIVGVLCVFFNPCVCIISCFWYAVNIPHA